ncbi:MAG: Crp/Fnr family transcriptional regulator [Bacteroidia bacterium]|nr:Crp/Fnr family transcriptional regulator [Bacteroidia bacterium]
MEEALDRFLARYAPQFQPFGEGRLALAPHVSRWQRPRRDCLVQAGEVLHEVFFVLRGAVRSYYLSEGTEVNTWFAFEDELVGSFESYVHGRPSRETLELMEDTELLVLHLRTLRPELQHSLVLSNLVRVLVEEYTAFLEARLSALQFSSASERYEWLERFEPEALKRVPVQHLASYLGVTRETLSRIRAQRRPLL